MTDPLDALHLPVTPIEPDPRFAAWLRRELRRALADDDDDPGGAMTRPTRQLANADFAWPPAVTPYVAVRDAWRALEWYAEVFDAHRRGEPYAQPDGSVRHAELAIGDGVLMLAEHRPGSPEEQGGPVGHHIHVTVEDVDATVRLARRGGATVEQQPTDAPHGRVAALVDPFQVRWLLVQPRRGARRSGGFYDSVVGGPARPVYRVPDLEAARGRVRRSGGRAGPVEATAFGVVADCVDDQGAEFQLWQPPA